MCSLVLVLFYMFKTSQAGVFPMRVNTSMLEVDAVSIISSGLIVNVTIGILLLGWGRCPVLREHTFQWVEHVGSLLPSTTPTPTEAVSEYQHQQHTDNNGCI